MVVPLCTVVKVGVNGESPECGGSSTPPPPGPECLDATDNTFWDGDGYVWVPGSSHWEGSSGGDLEAIGTWAQGFRPTTAKILLNSGPQASGFLTSNDLYIFDSSFNLIGSVTGFSFPAYETDLELEINLDFSSAGDIDGIEIGSFLYNIGPLIKRIEFCD